MITIKSDREIELLRIAGNIVYQTHQYLKKYIKPGVTTKELNDIADKFIRSKGGIPSFLNYEGYPASICTSINNEVVHGIPSNRKLKNGDIISIDIGVIYKGYHSDSAWTHPVGTISKDKEFLLEHTKKALYEGIKEVKEVNANYKTGIVIITLNEEININKLEEKIEDIVFEVVKED